MSSEIEKHIAKQRERFPLPPKKISLKEAGYKLSDEVIQEIYSGRVAYVGIGKHKIYLNVHHCLREYKRKYGCEYCGYTLEIRKVGKIEAL